MPENYAGKYTQYKDGRGKYVGKANKNQKTYAKGEVRPDPVSPDTMKRDITVCGAKRTGKTSAGPGTCCQPAGWGTEHIGTGRCKLHGGCLPTHNKSALLSEAVLTAKRLYGEDLDIDPYEALLGEVRRTAGAVIWLQEHIRELEDPERLKQVTNNMGITPSVWIQMYQQERAHLVRVAKACIDSGIAERNVRIAEQQGQLLAAVITAFLNDPDLGLSPVQMAHAPKLIRRHILALEGSTGARTLSGNPLDDMVVVDAEVVATAPMQVKAGGKLAAERAKAATARKAKATKTTKKATA